METSKAILLRKSVREYKPEKISDEVLDTILQSGFKAPVASNKYDSLHITIIQNTELLKRIINATSDMVYKILNVRKNMDFGAKTLIIISSTPAVMPGIEYANAACILENMVLTATDQSVDSIIWGGAAAAIKEDEALKKSLGIPDGFTPILCASFGYAINDEIQKEHTIAWNRI